MAAQKLNDSTDWGVIKMSVNTNIFAEKFVF